MSINISSELWDATTKKIWNHAERYSVPDQGGMRLLDVLQDSWREFAEEALNNGRWSFLPFTAYFSDRNKLHTLSSLLDRVVIQLILAEPGFRMQSELLNGMCDDDLMPLPAAFQFRPWLEQHIYSYWWRDYCLWQSAQELFAFRGYEWIVKADIRDCFHCINRDEALDIVSDFVMDPFHMKLLRSRMNSGIEWRGETLAFPFGLPVEEPSSHLFANAFLSRLDKWAITELAVPHVRYVDDMRFFCRSESEANHVLNDLRETLQARFGLRMNKNKSGVEKLPGTADSVMAAQLLTRIKESIQEPNQWHCGCSYQFVSMDVILDAWNRIQRAIESKDGLASINKSLNLLANLHPLPESTPSFVKLMDDVLRRACSKPGVAPDVQHHLIAIAMRHLRIAGGENLAEHLDSFLLHPDVKISDMAFKNLLWCKTNTAKQCEDHIVSLWRAGNTDLAKKRFVLFGKTCPVTATLRALFENDADRTVIILATRASREGDARMAGIVSDLSNTDPYIRRNGAITLLENPSDQAALSAALDRALACERHRDARLAMVLAAQACQAAFGKERSGSRLLLVSELEKCILNNMNSNPAKLKYDPSDREEDIQAGGLNSEAFLFGNPEGVENYNPWLLP